MAVAVKNSPDVGAGSPFDRLPIVSLAGVAYILVGLFAVFKLLPTLLGPVLAGMNLRSPADAVILAIVMLAAGSALLIFGARLLGPSAPAGSRAGVFVGLVGLLLVIGLARWASLWIEHWVYYHHLFGDGGPMIGAILSAVIAVALLLGFIRWFFRKQTENLLAAFEGQGWFSATTYKPLQGTRVRRGTILGLLIILIAGIYTLLSHGTLRKGSPNLDVYVPFTGRVLIDNPGDVGPHLDGLPMEKVQEGNAVVDRPVIDRYRLRAINAEHADPKKYVKLVAANRAVGLRGQEGTVIPRDKYDAAVKTLQEDFDRENANVRDEAKLAAEREFFDSVVRPRKADPEPASGVTRYAALTLLPGVQFTVPLLLLAGGLWLAWRVVNLPPFADFLIATEAELNKVSWTTRKRLVQDTIVVLTTVFLMAAYLFFVDVAWKEILSWKPIGVLQFFEEQTEANQSVEQKPW